MKNNTIKKSIICPIQWHYNEMPKLEHLKEEFLIRYYGKYKTLNYSFAFFSAN